LKHANLCPGWLLVGECWGMLGIEGLEGSSSHAQVRRKPLDGQKEMDVARKVTFVVYEGQDEVLVTVPSREKEMLREWFDAGMRPREEYDRTVIDDACVMVSAKLQVK